MASHAVHRRLARAFPDWDFFDGVAGMIYARRPRSSPPKVVAATDTDVLAEKIRQAEDPHYWRNAIAARYETAEEMRERRAQQEAFDGLRPASDTPPRWPGG